MAHDLGFVKRFTPEKPFDLPAHAFPPPEQVLTVAAGEASHVRPTDPAIWLTQRGRSRCFPWWNADNYHMINDVLVGDPVWIAF